MCTGSTLNNPSSVKRFCFSRYTTCWEKNDNQIYQHGQSPIFIGRALWELYPWVSSLIILKNYDIINYILQNLSILIIFALKK